jgi:hypothetical protein
MLLARRTSFVKLKAIAILCGIVLFAASANARPPDGPIPPQFFGMHLLFYSNPWPAGIEVGALGKGTLTEWPYIERSPGEYTWTDLDHWIDLADLHHIDMFHTVGPLTPASATDTSTSCRALAIKGISGCTALPSDLGRIDSFISALVTRYKGKIKFYEMANEPDTYTTAKNLITYVNRVVPIIRGLDPAAKIISPSMNARNLTIMRDYFSGGGTNDFDIVSLHSYPPRQAPFNVPESIDIGWQGRGDVHLLAPILPVLTQFKLAQKPIWSTEGSWGDRSYATGAANDQDLEAAFIARYHLLLWSNGVTRAYWYAWPTSGSDWGGLDGRKGAVAYKQVQKWMIGARQEHACSTQNGRIWTCTYSRSIPTNYKAIAVWDVLGDFKYVVPPEYNFYRDLAGNTNPVPPDRVVTVDGKVLWFESHELTN